MWLMNKKEFLLDQFERLCPKEIQEHSLAVARKAGESSRDREILFFAGLFHDIGKSEELQATSFHPLDGARYMMRIGEIHLAPLVARHTGADREAKILGISLAPWDTLSKSREIRLTPYQQTLDWADLTTAPDGSDVTYEERLLDVMERYGPASPEAEVMREMIFALELEGL